MHTIRYAHSDDFWTDNQAVILSHILRAELVYLNAHNHIAADRGFFGMAVKDGDSVLLAIRTAPYPMIFFGCGDALHPLATQAAEVLAEQGLIPDALHGDAASTQAVIAALEKKGARYRTGRHLIQRRCDALADLQTLALPLVNANTVAYDFMKDYRDFLDECHAAYDPAKLQTDIETMLRQNDLYVLTDHGAVVTMGRLQRILPGGRAVGVIYTPPKYRGQGYSTCCTQKLTRRIFEAGYAFAYLYAEADNPVSNHVYEKLGYAKTDDFIEYHRIG